MQRHRSIFDTFPENVDLNQGPNFNTRNMNDPDEYNNSRLSPTERRLLSNELSSELNFSRVNTNDHHNINQRYSNWDAGESSSRANPQDPIFGGNNGNNGSLRSDSNHLPMDVDLNLDYGGSFGSAHEMEASSSGTADERGPDCSFGNWGLSCKRKTLEGSGSSSRFPEAENIAWSSRNNNNGPMVNNNSRESIHAVSGVTFPPSTGIPESSSRRYYRDSGNVNISANGNPGSSSNPRGALWSPTNLNHSSNVQPQPPPPVVQAPGIPRNLLPFPSITREVNNSEANFRSSLRNNEQNRYFGPSNETRSSVQDPNSLSLGFGRASGNSRNEPGVRSNGIWTPRVNPTTQSQQRVSELPPWTLFPPSEGESGSGGHRGHFSFFPLESSSSRNSEENTNGQGRNGHPFSRSSSSSLMEVPGDEWQAFAADIEGRHRLVSEMRQILNVLRRGEIRAEDYMLFDPFINGVAELDRHRDMRLDVDNMSYEELLALEERIGDVKTGLTEEVILRSMKQRKHIAFLDKWNQNLEPCCICREEYHNGDDIGVLDCGHDFHTCCIKQWLSQKNLCPICKMPGLSTT